MLILTLYEKSQNPTGFPGKKFIVANKIILKLLSLIKPKELTKNIYIRVFSDSIKSPSMERSKHFVIAIIKQKCSKEDPLIGVI